MDLSGGQVRRDLLLITGLLTLMVVPSLFVRDLWNPDEPRYMEVTREMVVRGEYLVPHLNGETYPEKPPLFFWGAAVLWKLGLGFNAGRVLAAASCLATLWAVYFFTRRFLADTPPLLAALATLSVLIFAWMAPEGAIDPVLTAFVTGALLCGCAALHGASGKRRFWWLGAYALAGLATLTKGPVGFIVPGLVLAAYGLLNRRQVKGGGGIHLAGVALFAAIVLAWLVPAALAGGPEYRDTILVKQHFGRAVHSYSHREPVYYFLLRLPAHYFPWSLFLPFAAWAALRVRGSGRANGALFAAVWALVYIGFFSLISGKRAAYILPIAPALGMLSSWRLGSQSLREGNADAGVLWVHRVASGILLVLSVALMGAAAFARPILARIEQGDALLTEALAVLTPGWHVCAMAALAVPLAFACAGLHQALARRRINAGLLALTVILLFAAALPSAAPVVNVYKSGKLFCDAAGPHVARARVVYLYPQDYSGVYNLYTGLVRMPVITEGGPLREALAEPDAVVIGQRKSFLKVFTPDELAELTLMQRDVGHREMMVVGRAEARDPSDVPPGP